VVSKSESGWVFDVAEADFEREVIERSRERPVVVDFWAPWCGPCRMLGPILERLVEERNGEVLLAKVNTDEAQELAMQFGIQAIPAVKAFQVGRPVLEIEGVLPEEQLRQFLDQISPTEADRLVHQAAALEAEKPAEAEALYRPILEKDPNHEAAIAGLTRALMAQDRDQEAREILERIGPGGEQGAEYERLEALLFIREHGKQCGDVAGARKQVEADPENAQLRYELGCALAYAGQYPEALEQLLTAAERDPKLAREKVRELMVKIFYVVGSRSPLADQYRDKLSRLLY
jgi:putative thioredoxin